MQEIQKHGKKVLCFRIIKIAVFTFALCAFMTLSLKWHLDDIASNIIYHEDAKRPNTAWLVQYASVILPSLTMAVLLTVAYKIGNSYIPVKTQRDKTLIVGAVAIYTYAVLFAEICRRSEGWMLPPPEGEEDVKSLLEKTVIWFCVQGFCFMLMISYHLIKASSEKREAACAAIAENDAECEDAEDEK